MSQLPNLSFSEHRLESPAISHILAYPRGNSWDLAARITEAKSVGIESIVTAGNTHVGGVPILGKGCVGLVVMARHAELGYCALKIRRTDADRSDMSREAAFHEKANKSLVGPRIRTYSKNLLVMDIAAGQKIGPWIDSNTSGRIARTVAMSVLEQCFRLDSAGLDHGELSRINGHVIVSGDSATIIDFESASTLRKVSNVTSAAQALFLNGSIAHKIAAILGNPRIEKILPALRQYKSSLSRASFDSLIETLFPS